jgi:predicted 3-demethylubiquinone-9 3-methyltransferase (glyoxalase superfamily)
MLSWSGRFSSGPADQISTAVTFSDHGLKTKVHVHQTFHAMTPEIKHAAKGAKQGWSMTLDQLAEFCSGPSNITDKGHMLSEEHVEPGSKPESRQKIMPCLWFDDRAEEAANFYVSVFRDAKILGVARYGKSGAKASGKPEGSVMTVAFRIEGQEFLALNGGPQFAFSPAISLIVNCRSQQEIDELWKKLSADPEAEACGWLKDKFGMSWQIVPTELSQMMLDKDAGRAEKVTAALVGMKKLDLKTLQSARSSD